MISYETQYDVVVCGAGVAGVAAALESARNGMRTALIEKTIFPGGLATSGLISIYLPLCDGNGRQVTGGIAEELLHLAMRYGPGEVPSWRHGRQAKECDRFRIVFSPASFVLALDEALEQAGVMIWLDTLACTPVMEGETVAGVEVESKAGRGRLRAQCVIDATGDADIAFRAGAPCAEEGNVMALWAMQADSAAERALALDATGPARLGVLRIGRHSKAPDEQVEWRATDPAGVTQFVLRGRARLREHYQRLYRERGGETRKQCFPVVLPAMAQFRTTRRIMGRQTLSGGQHGLRRPDSVGLVADWRKPGLVWEMPYSALVPQKVRGLLAAGRCISSQGDAWEVTRVIPAAALTGQVCGLAAALAVRGNASPDQLPVDQLQGALSEKGIPL